MRAKLHEEFRDADKEAKFGKVGDLLRFLKARDFDIEKAWTMYSEHLKWREEFKPEEITYESIAAEAKLKKLRIHPPDKDGNITLVLCAGNHVPGEFPLDHTMRYTVYMAERAIAMMPPGQEKLNFIYDRTGFTRKNFDKSLLSSLGHLFEANYPERVAHIYVYQTDWLFSLLYIVVKPFLPAATVKKIKLLDTGDLKAEMLKLYEEDMLWHRFGGKWRDEDELTDEEKEFEKEREREIKEKEKGKDNEKGKGKEKRKGRATEKELEEKLSSSTDSAAGAPNDSASSSH